MTDSLRALLSGAIDYAGMYPPASLTLEQTVNNYRAYRSDPNAWLLTRFVCPFERLRDVAKVREWSDIGPLAVVMPSADRFDELRQNSDTILKSIAKFPRTSAIQALEFRLPEDAIPSNHDDRRLIAFLGQVYSNPIQPVDVYFECSFPAMRSSDPKWRQIVQCVLSELAEKNVGASNPTLGFKLRTGATLASAAPTVPQLASVIVSCGRLRVCWKATAGLHHAIAHRNKDSGVHEHGFLNVFSAAVLANVHDLDTAQVEALLEDQDASHFRFAVDAMSYMDFTATVDQITAARQRSLRSFGSCSFEEPLADLRAP